jgi:nucleotide-binding universal stress UspA family protein
MTHDERRIVVGVDGSDPSAAALRWALDQAAATGATVVEAVNAWELPGYYALSAGVLPPPPEGLEPDKLAAELLDQAVERETADRSGTEVRRLVLPGPAAAALLRRAEGAELLVVGSRGLGGFTGVLLGSVSRHVVEHAPCPVVVVRAPRNDT